MSDPNLTILVTIRGRRYTLPRVMCYYNDFPAKVIYLDSTPGEPYEEKARSGPHLYKHLPGKGYIEKIADCLKEVDTDYCIIMCDDDFLTKTSAIQSLEFLDTNKNYVAAWGQEICLRDEDLVVESYDYIAKNIEPFDDPESRVIAHWRYFNGGIVHTICRTEALRKVFDFHIENEDLDAIRYFDKTFGFCLAALGNIACLHLFHILRSSETGSPSLLLSDNETWTSNWKPHLRFNRDFTNHNLQPLADLIGSDTDLIEQLHSELSVGDYKKALHFSVMAQTPTKVEDFRNIPHLRRKVRGRPIFVSHGPGANFDGHDNYRERASYIADPAFAYPCCSPLIDNDLNIILEHVDKYPLPGKE